MATARGEGIRHEVDFWRDFLLTAGTYWDDPEIADDFRRRVDPEAVLDDSLIVEHLAAIPSRDVSILDVGAGPLTVLGKRYPGRRLSIVAVDPLADDYDRLLAEAGIVPTVRTERCAGEELLERFRPDTFDVVYARNALDHSADPVRIVHNMLALARPRGVVLLKHFRNEGEWAEYEGLHQWNFDVRNGRPVLWSPTAEHDLREEVGDAADVACASRQGWVEWTLRPRP